MRNVVETSKAAFRSLKVEELNETYRQILDALREINEGTFEDLAAYMRVDKSRVWKRLSELDRMELIYRSGNKRMLKSGRMGFTWMLRNPVKTDNKAREVAYKPIEPSIVKSSINVLRQANLFQ